MKKSLKKIISRFFSIGTAIFSTSESLPHISDSTLLREVATHYPAFVTFLAERYRISPAPAEWTLSLAQFVEKKALPPARIVFMESQLAERMKRVAALPASAADELLRSDSKVRVIDAREAWEWKTGGLPGARQLNREQWREITETWPRETPLLVYCHFGVRSLDVSLSLAEEGFTHIYTLQGGIDAWSQQVDARIPRYTGSYC